MAIMIDTRTLREAPFGASMKIDAVGGQRVKVLDDTSSPIWIKIELIDSPLNPKPQGWVNEMGVNKTSDVAGTLDKAVFATQCVFHGMIARIVPHYMMAIARMRTNVMDGAHGDDYGPFALSLDEWNHFDAVNEFGPPMGEDSYRDWVAQCILFSFAINVTQSKLAGLLANQPTFAQLALAQMIGTTAALRVIRAPELTIANILNSVPDMELQDDAINRIRLPGRYEALLKDKTGGEALEAVTMELQKAFDETRPYIAKAGADHIDFVEQTIADMTASSDFISASVIANKTVRYIGADGSTLTKKGGSRSWRKNNPGNIIKSNFAKANGAIGQGSNFAIFPSKKVGLNAIGTLLTGPSYRDRTLIDAVKRYAPPSENNTVAYIAFIVSRTGIKETDVIGELSPAQLKDLTEAIVAQESWTPGTEARTEATVATGGNVTAEMIARAALTELDHWKGKTERSPGYAEYVYENYYKAVYKNPSINAKQRKIDQISESRTPHYAWSACAISFFMKTAGYTTEQFKYSASHSVYIRNSVAAKKNKDQFASYWGYRVSDDDAIPAVGDIVGCARKKSNQTVPYDEAQAWYNLTESYLSHADVVVAVRPGEIDVVGGNVSDSVSMKTLATDVVSGKLIDKTHPWFVVMKRRLPA